MTQHPFRFTFFLLACLIFPLIAKAQVVSIPDSNLRAAIENALGKASGATITAADMAKLTHLEAKNANISNLTGLEAATELTWLDLGHNNLSNISPLAGLTNLKWLWLQYNALTDISPVTRLTNLIELVLQGNAITDISPLSSLTNLTGLWLAYNTISDISPLVANTGLGSGDRVFVNDNPLSSASINTHIPALQSRGVTVEFDNQAHPALLKISGDNQTGTSTAALSDPFIIEVQDANGTTLAGVSVTFTVTNGGGTLNATNTTTDANGRAESTLTLGPNLEKNTVEVSAAGIESLVTFYAISESLPLGVQGAQIYWMDESDGKIHRANLDGTGVENLVTGLKLPRAIALGVVDGKMYWTEAIEGKIHRANLDGTGVENLVTGLKDPRGIALNMAGGKMYWTDFSQGKIQCASLDGIDVEDLVTELKGPRGIMLDMVRGQMYWTEAIEGKIYRANLDGTGVENLVTGLGYPIRIALDVADGKMYWTDIGTYPSFDAKIQCANFDGTGVEDLVTGLESPIGIALAIPPDLPPARADVNQDGKVNITDLLLVVSTLGDITPTLLFGDVNEDDKVTIDDVLLVIEALDDPVTAAAPSNNGRRLPLEGATLEGHLNRLRSHSDGSLKYQRAIAFFQNLLASVAPPDKTQLLANYPNPFNPETWIPYRLAEDALVTLTIYDLSGRVVRTLTVGHRIAAAYESRSKAIYWDGRNVLGEQVASGVYFYHLSAGDYSATRRMIILK